MEKSKHYSDVLALGSLLVKELDLEQSGDTLGRWMAHHISELIVEAKKAKGSDKSDAEDRCREAVLALWKHISTFPGEHRPLENIEALLATIQALDPENQAFFYQSQAENQIRQSTLSDQAKAYLELSLGIDYSARLIIDMCLAYAANEITKEKRDLLDLVRSLDADTSQTYIVNILTDKREKSDVEQKAEIICEAIETLRSRRERLRGMIELSESLVSSIDEDIKSLEQSICE